MKIALLADIHANLEALLAVISDAKERQVSEFICAGDLVDYGPDPNEVITEAVVNNFVTVMGNHDQGAGFDLTFPEFQVTKGRNLQDELAALSWTQRHTSNEKNNADIYVLGHLHIPYQDKSAGALIINPGSVGKPKDNDRRASYAILELAEKAAIEFCRVNYDIEAVGKKINGLGLPGFVAAALLAGK